MPTLRQQQGELKVLQQQQEALRKLMENQAKKSAEVRTHAGLAASWPWRVKWPCL